LLRVKNIAVAAQLEVPFDAGLNLLTGETGAGKSILVDALGLLSGERASADLIRTGEDHAVVEGLLEADGLRAALEQHGLPAEEDEVIVRRELQSGGKGRATLNGALVPLSALRELIAPRIEIHGQHEQHGLLDPENHVHILDRQAGLATEVAAVAHAYEHLRQIEVEIETLTRDRRELLRRRDMVEFQLREIEAARLDAEEEDALRREKLVVANADRLRSLAAEAYALLYDDEHAVVSRLGQAMKRVEELAGIDPSFAAHVAGRERLRAEIEDLSLSLRDYAERIQVTPGRLDAIEERLSLIERLKKKYGTTVAEVLAFAERARRELETLGSPEERLSLLERASETAAERYSAAAGELSRRRRAGARELERRMHAELGQLAMEKTRFCVRFDPEPPEPDDRTTWTALGAERVEFLLSPNPGEELRPLAKIASGGELSRILLALESAASAGSNARTLVFDEVDVGIGGRVAEVVGRKLRALSERHQVLCVTHLPQIAALADRHCAVRKRVERGRTLTEIQALQGDDRVEEVARMLAGETVTENARRHAREMVKQALRPSH
jgi:DNA repair protein RecN (Recombination protein N)